MGSFVFLQTLKSRIFIRIMRLFLKNSFEILHSPDPKFVGAAVIPDNDDRDDDKVYFFFTELETNLEGAKKAVHTHVGRVCAVRTPK